MRNSAKVKMEPGPGEAVEANASKITIRGEEFAVVRRLEVYDQGLVWLDVKPAAKEMIESE